MFRNQQWEVRTIVQARPFPHMILPFAALEAAAIERATINPIEVRPDERILERHLVEPFNLEDAVWSRVIDGAAYQGGHIPGRPELTLQRRIQGYRHFTAFPIDPPDQVIQVFVRPWRRIERDPEGNWFWIEHRHRLGDSVFRAKAHGAYRTFVSSFDYQETNPLYFLAELPWNAKVASVDEAIASLAPPIVRQAREQKRAVKRQGDIFAIPTELSTADVRARTTGTCIRMQGVLGTDHVVTEQYVGKHGVTYARGWMHHKPPGRRGDHMRVHLSGKVWHLIVPNAVPRRRAGAMVRG